MPTSSRIGAKQFFIFAGEQSGDLHGSNLVKAMLQQIPNIRFIGVGGPQMRILGVECILTMEDFELMGFSDVLMSLPKQIKQFYKIRNAIMTQRPAVVILIDYPGFNLRLARSLRKKGYTGKIMQYISPTVWAWGSGRIKTMAESLDLLLTILPFEPECFKETSLPVQYVGHPTVETLSNHRYEDNWLQNLGFEKLDEIIALFPGSRKGELLHNLPKQLEAAKLLKELHPQARFAISCARQEFALTIRECITQSRLKIDEDAFTVPSLYSYELMRDCRTAIAKSGTVTLELALHQKPTVVVYQLTRLNKFIAQYCLRLNLPYYCLVNILAKQEVFPELIANGYTPESLCTELNKLHKDSKERENCISACIDLQNILEHKSASKEAAKAIEKLIC